MLNNLKIKRLQIRAKRRHNLNEEEFYNLLPYELLLYEEDLEEELKQLDFRVARVCAVIVNVHRDSKSTKVYTEEDFMPKPKKRKTIVDSVKTLATRFGFRKVED